MLTAAQKKRLSKEAVTLAAEIAEGRVLKLDPFSYCGCAAHELAKRSGFLTQGMSVFDVEYISSSIADLQPLLGRDSADLGFSNLLSDATYLESCKMGGHGSLIFPLLDLACDLDPFALDEPRAAPSSPPNTRKER